MKKTRVVSSYITQFGELWDRSLESLFSEAVSGALATFPQKVEQIEAVFVANMASGQYANQLHLNALVSQMLPHNPPAFRLEAACASGSLALEAAELALLSGRYKTVLVVGAEKMTDVSGGTTTDILAGASHYQAEYGSNFPALYALLAQQHMHEFGTTREQLSLVAAKNHLHAIQNQKAQFRKEIPAEVVSKSMPVADPLRLLDCSPVSDGAAAVILSAKNIGKFEGKPEIIGFGHGQDSLNLAQRKSLTQLEATKKAAALAFTQAGITPKDISFAEVHDCFTIAEILATEDLGFFKKGSGGMAVAEGKTTYGGSVVINPSGGLKACGHPVGATGIKQVAFLAELLEKKKQTQTATTKSKSKKNVYALAHNVGGSGATAIVHILKQGQK